MRRGRLAITILAGAAIAALIVFGLSASSSKSVGRHAPALPHERLAGPAVTLSQLLSTAHGRATVVTFWARSWVDIR